MLRPISFLIIAGALFQSGCSTLSVDAEVDTRPASERNYPNGLSVSALSCTGCHADTAGRGIPSLAGRSADQLLASLRVYGQPDTGTTVMHRIARGYTDEQLTALADYFAEQV